MKVKMFLSLFISAFFILGLTGCTNDSSSDAIVVEIFQFKSEIAGDFDRLAQIYYDETGVRIQVTTVGGGSDYGGSLRTQFASGDGPAIFNVGGPQDVDDWQEHLADLSGTQSAQLALYGTLDPVTVDGKVLAIPFGLEGYGFIYNQYMFEQAGIDSSTLTTFEALIDAVLILDSMKEELGIQAVFAFPAAETWVTGLHSLSPAIGAETGDVVSTFNTQEIAFTYNDSYRKLINLQNDFSVQPTVTLDYSQQVERLFALQQVAIIQQGNWAFGSIYAIDEDLATNGIGMFPIPFYGIDGNPMPVGIPMYWTVNSNLPQETQDAAKDFLDWMHTSETGQTFVLEYFNFIPAYSGFDSERIVDPLSIEVYSQSLAGNTSNWVFMGFPTDWGQGIVGQDIQRYITGNMEWEDLVDNAIYTWSQAR
jgi:raffinose/stachyose/melibiose transport system substrate-binding protein